MAAEPDQSVNGGDLQESVDALKEAIVQMTQVQVRQLGMQSTFGGSEGSRSAAQHALGAAGSPLAGMTTTQALMHAGSSPAAAKQTAAYHLANWVEGAGAGRTTTHPSNAPAGGGGGGTGGGHPGTGGGRGGGSPGEPSGPPAGGTRVSAARKIVGQTIRNAGNNSNGIEGLINEIPGVGLITGLMGAIGKQRDENAVFQSMEGGKSNANAFGDMANQARLGYTDMGMFSSADSAARYTAVTALGYDDRSDGKFQSRQGALDFQYQAKSSMGMSVDESTKMLQLASQSTTTSFNQLEVALQKVSVAAGQAGVNAEQARAGFAALFSGGTQAGFSGNGSITAATSISQFNVGAGRAYTGDSAAEMSTSSGFSYMTAAQNGLSMGAYSAMNDQNPVAAAGMRDKTISNGINNFLTPQMKSVITRLMQPYGGPSAFTNGGQSMTDQIYDDFLAQTNTNPNIMMQAVGGLTGQTFNDPRSAFYFLVQKGVLGQTEAASTAAAQKASQVQKGFSNGSGIDPMIAGLPGADKFSQSTIGASDAQTAFLTSEQKSNTTDPLISAMFTKMGSDNTDQNGQQVIVQTKGGPRLVSLKDAISKFPNEVATGMAKFSGGSLDGQDIGQYTGMALDLTRKAAAATEVTAGSNQGIGSAYNAGNGTAADGSSVTTGGVTVTLSQEAQNWLKLTQANTPSSATSTVTPPSSGNLPGWPGGH